MGAWRAIWSASARRSCGARLEPRIDSSGQDQAIIAALSEDERDGQTATSRPQGLRTRRTLRSCLTQDAADDFPPYGPAQRRDPKRAPDVETRPRPEPDRDRDRRRAPTPTAEDAHRPPASLRRRRSRVPKQPSTGTAQARVRAKQAAPVEDGPTIVDTSARWRRSKAPRRSPVGCGFQAAQYRTCSSLRRPVLEIDQRAFEATTPSCSRRRSTTTACRASSRRFIRVPRSPPTRCRRRREPRSPRWLRSPTISRSGFRARSASSRRSPAKIASASRFPTRRACRCRLRDLVEDQRFVGLQAPLPVVLGRDHVGAPYFADLASMPHVIVAGATGAGKSVGLNVMLDEPALSVERRKSCAS